MRRRLAMTLACVVLLGASACASSAPRHPLSDVPTAATTVTLPGSVTPGDLVVASVTWNGSGRVFARGGVQAWAAAARSEPVVGDKGWHSQVIYGIATGDPAPVRVEVTDGSTVRADVHRWSGVDAATPLIARSTGPVAPVPGGGRALAVSVAASSTGTSAVAGRVVDASRRTAPLVSAFGGRQVQTFLFALGSSDRPDRDVLRQPFSDTSIWNTAIGADAVYVDADMPARPGGDRFAPMPQNDETSIIETPDAPMTELRYSDAAWTGRDRCEPTSSRSFFSVPMPADYTVPQSTNNEGASWLMPDGRTVMQSGPLARCTPGGPATSLAVSDPVDLYGDGISRNLGGSGLSGLVGALRLGELRPSTEATGPRHALRVNIDTSRQLRACPSGDCFRWPASTSDSDAEQTYGSQGSAPSAMRLGALLAIPLDVDIDALGLQTVPGRQIAWTLQNYGAYVADSAACACFAIVTEKGPKGRFADQFRSDYGYPFEQRIATGSAWARDLQRIQELLVVVDDNSPSDVGGGGLPAQPAPVPVGR
ncbi:hypothetical protein [Williamsia deligens]|uniref:Uncharacterized protein n=1 Tax=Williamsia deligens TaxID=321325 RepID=A0ABW3G865_9NOCA|nr:hypothetical protein [Williamsia deligens]MCP2194172.1 hypothetical protein [Williamsia deligens]